ncbi:MAG: DUF3791 domain-containing protein [Fibrobacter sp.]|nr:DUF3791 domain-containing protein [Fibrobacter sp.]MDY6391114.1 DUF3791 domain-containing protein [Fibrobacter sp.]
METPLFVYRAQKRKISGSFDFTERNLHLLLMAKEMEFFSFLMEQYAAYKGTTANKILAQLEEKKLTDFVYSMYERYHTEAIENAFEDLDRLLQEK